MRRIGSHVVHPGSVGNDIHGLVGVGGDRGVGGVGAGHLVDYPGNAQVVWNLETLRQTSLIVGGHRGGRREPGS